MDCRCEQRTRQPCTWDDAAANVTQITGMYGRLLYNFKGLKVAAERYGLSTAGGSFRSAQGALGRNSKKVGLPLSRPLSCSTVVTLDYWCHHT